MKIHFKSYISITDLRLVIIHLKNSKHYLTLKNKEQCYMSHKEIRVTIKSKENNPFINTPFGFSHVKSHFVDSIM